MGTRFALPFGGLVQGKTPPKPPQEEAFSMNEKRTKIIRIRVTDSEYQMFSDKSGDHTISAWIRSLAETGKPPKRRKHVTMEPALLRQFAGIGNNINQIAKQVNYHKGAVEEAILLTQLSALEREVTELRKVVENGD